MVLLWILAVVITLATAVYQRTTGPTYPKKHPVNIDGTDYTVKLLRSHGGKTDTEIQLNLPVESITGKIYYRRYPTEEKWISSALSREGDILRAQLPHQPPAGKLEYYIILSKDDETIKIAADSPVVIRFKGHVPGFVILPHILIMFLAMVTSNLSGLLVLGKHIRYRFYTNLTFVLILAGGMILGPVTQYYAFGEFWTGVPFGWDLTDNKTLITFIAWLTAVAGNRKKARPYLTLIACIVTLVIFLIPHSMYGSELDPHTGKITTG